MLLPPSFYTDDCSIADVYNELVRKRSPAQAVELLGQLYLAGHFRTRLSKLAPSFLSFAAGADGTLIVTSPEGELDPDRILVRPPGLFDPVPVPLAQLQALMPTPDVDFDRLRKVAKPRTLAQFLAENPYEYTLKGREGEAAEWLAARLISPADTVALGEYRDECIKLFSLTPYGYNHRVWPTARWLVRLPRQRASGRRSAGGNKA
jgi:hypothetical protein